jgi:hypothetical protein
MKLGIDTATDLYLRVKELEQKNADLRRQLEEARKDSERLDSGNQPERVVEEWVCVAYKPYKEHPHHWKMGHVYYQRLMNKEADDYAPGTVLRVTAEVVKEVRGE